jgi:hypothetical protein
MKIKIKITGRKVHDIGYRYFLMSMAMSNRIRMFEAHNLDGSEGEEVLIFVDAMKRPSKPLVPWLRPSVPFTQRCQISSLMTSMERS